MGIMSSIISMILNVTLKGEMNKINNTLSPGGEYYELAKKADQATKDISNKVNSGLQDLIGTKTEDELYNKLINNELNADELDALQFGVDAFKQGIPKGLDPQAKQWLQNASNALDKYKSIK